MYQIKKKDNETLIEFNMIFQSRLDKIPDNAKPIYIVVLTFYLNAFDAQFGLSLKQKEPADLQDSMEKYATPLESYLARYSKVDPLATSRVSIPKVEKNTKTHNHVEGLMDPPTQITKMMI